MAPHAGIAIAIALAGCSVETSGLGATGSVGRADVGVDPRADAGGRDAPPASDGGGDPRDTGTADAGPSDSGPSDAAPRDTGPPDTGPVCPGGGLPMPETCNGVDDDCDGVRDEDESALCADGSKCLAWDRDHFCMVLACPSDPCCSGTGTNPCTSPYTCEHVAFSAMDCPPECAGQCGNCHMCVVR